MLKYHVKNKVCLQEKKNIVCQLCLLKYSSKNTLLVHLRKKHMKKEKKQNIPKTNNMFSINNIDKYNINKNTFDKKNKNNVHILFKKH